MAALEIDGGAWTGEAQHRLAFDEEASGPTLRAGWTRVGAALEVSADRLGMVPVFYAQAGKRFLVSDSLAELAKRLPNPRFDPRAVAAYLQLGYYLGEETPLLGVKALLPGGRLRWDGSLSVSPPSYVVPPPFTGSRDEAAREFQRLFADAVQRRAERGVGRLTLSGGRDSRHILLELIRLGFPPPAVAVLDRGNSNDHEVALDLAGRLGVRSILARQDSYSILLDYEKNRRNHYLSDENTWYLDLLPLLEGPVFDGLAGDVLANGLYFREPVAAHVRQGKTEAGARLFLSDFGAHLSYLAPRFRKLWNRDLALESVTAEFARFASAANPVQSFVFWNRTRREIALLPLCLAASRVQVRLPYLDPPLVEFLLSLPFERFGSPGFHDLVIRESYPNLAMLSYAEKKRTPARLSTLLRYIPAAVRSLHSPLVVSWRAAAYAIEAAATRSAKPLDTPLSRLLPLMQLHDELNVPFD